MIDVRALSNANGGAVIIATEVHTGMCPVMVAFDEREGKERSKERGGSIPSNFNYFLLTDCQDCQFVRSFVGSFAKASNKTRLRFYFNGCELMRAHHDDLH